MVDLTDEVAVTLADLTTWFKLKAQLAEVKGAEAMLRGRIFKFFFPTPTEGAKDNKFALKALGDTTGAVLQADHTINRKVDESELEALRDALLAAEDDEKNNLHGIDLDLTKLIKWKPEVSITEYRKLSEAQQAVFDRCLVITPGSPQMEIKIPKRPS